MENKIIASDKEHLQNLIKAEIKSKGYECDLNHIDVSNLTDMSYLFSNSKINGNLSKFNGDISRWDVSNVENMFSMFFGSEFNGDISKWDVSKVNKMSWMFGQSKFNGDILGWNVFNVINMTEMFYDAQFDKDLSDWKPYNLQHCKDVFLQSPVVTPYWIECPDLETRRKAIDSYHLAKKLQEELGVSGETRKKLKL